MNRTWPVLQTIAVVAALAMVGVLFLWPDTGLMITWKLLIPLVPLSLLLTPRLWRNLCPIATLSQLPLRLGIGGARRFPLRAARGAAVVAAIGLFVLVPLRHPLLDQSGTALGIFVLLVVVTAVAGGMVFDAKSGFCASICPVLPVERLYGQSPLFNVNHAHCSVCTACVRDCIDINERRSIENVASPGGIRSRDDARPVQIHLTPMGAFALSFPGFILGFFTVDTGASTLLIYGWMAAFAALSYAIFAAAYSIGPTPARWALTISGALAFSVYYWFTVPKIANAVAGLGGTNEAASFVIVLGRLAIAAIVIYWLQRAFRQPATTLAPA